MASQKWIVFFTFIVLFTFIEETAGQDECGVFIQTDPFWYFGTRCTELHNAMLRPNKVLETRYTKQCCLV